VGGEIKRIYRCMLYKTHTHTHTQKGNMEYKSEDGRQEKNEREEGKRKRRRKRRKRRKRRRRRRRSGGSMAGRTPVCVSSRMSWRIRREKGIAGSM